MSRKPRCRTCGKVLVGPLRGGRIYCGPECWTSRPRLRPQTETLQARRDKLAAEIEQAAERGESTIIDELVLRRLDRAVADEKASRPTQNGKAASSVIDELAKRGRRS
jgi:hypothetical protein